MSEQTRPPTEEQRFVPPMVGLALMAGRLANTRRGSNPDIGGVWVQDRGRPVMKPLSRGDLLTPVLPSGEYYRIIDRISRGEKP